jgi:hypothetical protein
MLAYPEELMLFPQRTVQALVVATDCYAPFSWRGKWNKIRQGAGGEQS